MLRKIFLAILAVVFLNFNAYPAYSQELVELSDSELDEVLGGASVDAVVDLKSGTVDVKISEDALQSETLKALSSGNSTFNSVDVSETAQQNLNALINVNAAGSIVPVQLNLVVLNNSTVGEIVTNNVLNLNFNSPLN